MSAHRRPRKLVQLSAALGLMAAAGLGGYAAADAPPPTPSGLAEAANVSGASGHSLTIYACLAGGRLTHVSTKAPKCASGSPLVPRGGQARPAAGRPAPPPPPRPATPRPTPKPSPPSSPPPPTPPSSTPPGPSSGPACVTSTNDGGCGPDTFAGTSGSTAGPNPT